MKYLVDQQQHLHIAAQWWDDVARKVNYSTNNEEGTSTYRHNWASLKTLSSGKLLSFFIRAKSTVNAMIFHVPQVKLMIALAWENQISSWCDAKIFDGHILTATPRAARFLYIECKTCSLKIHNIVVPIFFFSSKQKVWPRNTCFLVLK